jgi:hypothetical protein
VEGWVDLDMIKPLLDLIIYLGVDNELLSRSNI